jgi:dihydroorotase-like cyclic amidohydrolase
MKIEITHGRLIDPAQGIDRVAPLYIAAGRIVSVGTAPGGWTANRTLDAKGFVVCPGLVDVSARLREPGFEYKATLESEMEAAGAGGVSSLACPPDTDPPLDEPGLVEMLKHRARSLNRANVYPIGALTQQLAGTQITEMNELAEAGCVAFSQAEQAIVDTQVLFRAMQYAANVRPIASGCGRRTRTWREAASLTTARSPPASGWPRFRRRRKTIAIATILSLAREKRRPRSLVPVVDGRGGRDGARGQGFRAVGHLRRGRSSPAPLRCRYRLVRCALPTSSPRCVGHAIARRCGPASPTARST